MKKRLFSLLLALLLCLSLAPVAAFAASDETVGEPVEEVARETEPEQTAVDKVQALIDALPDADTITEENRADVEARLTAIDEAKLPLGDELDSLDFTKYNAAIAALNELDGMGGAEVPETLEDTLQGSGTATDPWILTQDSFTNASENEGANPQKHMAFGELSYYSLSSGCYKLGEDITLRTLIDIPPSADVTLDLNGFTLRREKTNEYDDCEAIDVDNDYDAASEGYVGSTFTLTDSSQAKTGMISNGHVHVDMDSTFTMNGGTISGAEYGVYIYGGTFNMTDGKIINCTMGIFNRGTVTLPSGTTLEGDVVNTWIFPFAGNTFKGEVQHGNVAQNGNIDDYPIDGGTFLSRVQNGFVLEGSRPRHGQITDGVFYGEVINYAGNQSTVPEPQSEIAGGVFYGKVTNMYKYEYLSNVYARITGGVFYGEVENDGVITGGVFLGGITGNGTIEGTRHSITVDFGNGTTRNGIVVGDTLYPLGEPPVTREGYKFVGWYKDAEFTEPWDFTNQNPVEEGNMAFYAKWVCAVHSGGTATCQAQATCETCGEEYGELDSSNHVGGTEVRNAKDASCTEDGYTGDTYCLGCEVKLQDGKPITKLGHIDADKNHVCDRENCKATLSTCSGGTATCKDKAVCEYCGKPYGELDSSTHAGGTEVRNAKDAKCTEDGYTGDTYCKGCDTKLSSGKSVDKTGHDYESKVTKEATTTSTGTKTYTCKNCGHSYEEEIAKLTPEPTATPAPTAKPAHSPKTGDEANVMLWLGLGLSAALTLGYVSVRKKEN